MNVNISAFCEKRKTMNIFFAIFKICFIKFIKLLLYILVKKNMPLYDDIAPTVKRQRTPDRKFSESSNNDFETSAPNSHHKGFFLAFFNDTI